MSLDIKKLVGNKYGKLTILEEAIPYHHKDAKYPHRVMKCKCDCGKIKYIRLSSLRSGLTTTCGCKRIKHGQINTTEYKSWMSIKHHGNDQICDRWLEKDIGFINFKKDMGVRPDNTRLIRINIDKLYSKSNCRWQPFKKKI